MQKQGLITIALAGTASAVLFVSAPASPLMAVLQMLTQLPLLFCGLTLGLKPLLIASALGMTIVLMLGGMIPGLVFALASIVPCIILVRQWLLSRTDEQGNIQWYPLGWLVAQLAIYFLALVGVVVLALESQSIDVTTSIVEVFSRITETIALPQGQSFDPALFERLAKFVPAMMAVVLLTSTLINAIVAQRLAARSGNAQRPTPALATLSLPGWAIIALAATTLGTIVFSGTVFIIAATALALMMALFFIQGQAVVHAYLQPRPWRGPMLILFYLLVVFLGWVALFVVILGLAEDRLHLRQRFT